MKKQFRVGIGIFLFAITIVSMFGLALPVITFASIKATVVAAAAQTVTNAVTTADIETASGNLLMDDVSKIITKMQPDNNPLDTIMREIGSSETSTAWKATYYSVGTRGIEDTVSTGIGGTTGTALTGAGNTNVVSVTNPKLFQRDDVIMFSGIKGYDETTGLEDGELAAIVIGVTGYQLTLFALNSGITNSTTVTYIHGLPAIPNGTKITNIGNNKFEKDASTDPYNLFPVDEFNYNQIHMAQVEESVYTKMLDKQVKWELNDMQALSLYSYRQRCEMTSLFGSRGKIVVPTVNGNQLRYFSGGITRSINSAKVYSLTGADVINDAWVNALAKETFSGNTGSDTRILFASPSLLEAFQNAPTIAKQIENNKSEFQYGVWFKRIETTFGNFLLKQHKGFQYVPTWADRGVILDVNYIEKHVLKPLEVRHLDQKTAGISNTDAIVMDEAFCMLTRYPDLHKIIKKA